MDIKALNHNNSHKNFQAIKRIPLSNFSEQNLNKIFDNYEIISKKYNNFNSNFKKDYIQKFPFLRTEHFSKGFLLHSEDNIFHLVKNAPRSPLKISFFKNNQEFLNIKKDTNDLLLDYAEDFDAKINKLDTIQLNNMLVDLFNKVNEELQLLFDYTKFFNKIKGKITPKTTKNEIKNLIINEQKFLQTITTPSEINLAPEISDLYEQYNNLHKIIYQKNGAFTARFKEAYFGKNSPHEKGLTFNINEKKVNIMPIKNNTKEANGIRTVIFHADNSVDTAFVLYTDGLIKQIKHKDNYKKLMDFNLKLLTDQEIKNANITNLLTTLSLELQKYKNFIFKYLEEYHVVRHKKEFKTKIEITKEKENRILAKEKLIRFQKTQKEAEKLKNKENKRILKAENALKKYEERAKNVKNKKLEKQKTLNQTPVSKLTYTKEIKSFSDINITTLVDLIKEVFATPVEKRNPRFSHELLNNNKIFSGRFFIIADDGTKVSVTKVKSPKYVDFEYFSIRTDKNGISNVINIDSISNDILYTTTDGKVLIKNNAVKHITKKELADKFPNSDKIATYLKELFYSDKKGKIIKSNLKFKNTNLTKEEIFNAELQLLDNSPCELQNIDTPW